jgi:hypothetical protein
MKSILTLLLVGVVLSAKSQELKFSFNTGVALGETSGFKKNMLNTEALIGFEGNVARGLILATSLGISKIRFDYQEIPASLVFNQKTSIVFTAEFKKIIPLPSSKNYFFAGIGAVENFALFDKKEIYSNNVKTTQTKSIKGFNVAIMVDFGYRAYFTPKSSVSLSLSTQNDVIKNYKNDADKIKYDKILGSVTYYMNLKKK